MPAIHKNREQIARLFGKKIREAKYTEDVDQLTAIARRVLRQKFFEADAGLSGVNFAVAETGTLCLVENEGNGRMTRRKRSIDGPSTPRPSRRYCSTPP